MESYRMTQDETIRYDSGDERVSGSAWSEIVKKLERETPEGKSVEVYHPEGYVVDVIEGRGMTQYMRDAVDSAPEGTSGLVIAPWSQREVHGVAADWSQASSPVYFFGADGWESEQYQVANFSHRPFDALEYDLCRSLIDSGADEGDAQTLMVRAEKFEAAQ